MAFLDALTEELPEVIQGSICVVGAGAAGITLARKLLETHSDVILVESGGFAIDGRTQSLFAGRQLGLDYFNLTACRLRYFGGTSNHWSGFCRENDLIDYEGRPELGLPKWPISRDDLAPYIAAAGETLKVSDQHFETREMLAARGIEAPVLAEDESEILQTKTFQFAANKRLGRVFRAALAEAPNLKGVLHLNLVHIQLDASGTHVTHLLCKTLEGRSARVEAKAYVLATHAIENARQLLASNDVQPEGIGNRHGHVGRYFMDHIHVFASRLIPTPAFPLLYNQDFAAAQGFNANLSFTDAITRSEKILQYYCRCTPVYVSEEVKAAVRNVATYAMEPGDLQFLRDVATVTTHGLSVAKLALAKTDTAYPLPDYYRLDHRIEQAPNPNSRVVLSDRLDALGQRIADLDWQITDHDVASIARGQALALREMAAMGWGRIEEEEITRALVEERVEGHYHQIGTTRMSEAPEDGVVDRNCKVHGIDNLYVAGSSVFPTAGYSGPTMMLIGMALRLADHLQRTVR